jgi:hypothetical protein
LEKEGGSEDGDAFKNAGRERQGEMEVSGVSCPSVVVTATSVLGRLVGPYCHCEMGGWYGSTVFDDWPFCRLQGGLSWLRSLLGAPVITGLSGISRLISGHQ